MAQEEQTQETPKLEQLDPIFAMPPAKRVAPTAMPAPRPAPQPAAAPSPAAQPTASQDLDSILNLPPPPPPSSTTQEPSRKGTQELGFLETTTPREAGEYGAVAGALTGLVKPGMPRSTGIPQAQANVAGSAANVQALQSQLAATQTAQTASIGDVMNSLKAARAQYDQAQIALAQARQQAQQLSALPTATPTTPPPANAPAGMGSTPDALSEGAMRHSEKMGEIRQANTVRKGIAGYGSHLPPEQRMPLTGYAQSSRLIVPAHLANAPIYNQAQIDAQQRLAQAEANFRNAQTELNRYQSAYDRLTTSRPAQNISDSLSRAQRQQAVAEAKLSELKKSAPGMFTRIGQGLTLGGSRLPSFATSVGGGALAGYEGMNAYLTIRNELQKDQPDYLKMLMHSLGATSGALMMAPNLAAKGVGAAIGMPPLLYQAYKSYEDRAPTALPEARKPLLPPAPGG
jgi:multidrug efflux pump subunit AcrA (membrane-fusion protein)